MCPAPGTVERAQRRVLSSATPSGRPKDMRNQCRRRCLQAECECSLTCRSSGSGSSCGHYSIPGGVQGKPGTAAVPHRYYSALRYDSHARSHKRHEPPCLRGDAWPRLVPGSAFQQCTKHGAKHIQSESGTKGQHSPRPAGRVLLRTVGSLSEQSSKTRTRRVPSPACQPLLQPQHPQPTSPWYLMHIAYPTHAFRRSQQTLALHANIDFTSSSSHPTHQSPSPQPPIQTLSKYARSL